MRVAWLGKTAGIVMAAGVVTLAGGCGRGAATNGPTPAQPSAATPAPPRLEAETAHRTRESSATVVAKLGERHVAFVADLEDRVIRAFDTATLAPLATTEPGGSPRHLLLTYDGRLLVTLPAENVIVAFEAAGADGSLMEIARVKTSSEPLALALDPDETRVLAVTGASHRLESYDAVKLAKAWSIDAAREPRAVLVGSDGKRAFVSHAAASELESVALAEVDATKGAPPPKAETDPLLSIGAPPATGPVSRVRLGLSGGMFTKAGSGEPARSARHAYAMVRSRAGDEEIAKEQILVPLVQNATEGASPGGYGAGGGFPVSKVFFEKPMPPQMNSSFDFFDDEISPPTPENAKQRRRAPRREFFGSGLGLSAFDVATLDATTGAPVPRSDNRFTGLVKDCLLPHAAIATARGAVIACEGQSELFAVETTSGWPKVERRLAVPRGPSALARVPGTNRAIVWSSIGRAVSRVDIDGGEITSASVARARQLPDDEIAGREIFFRTGEKGIARDGVACATCHPDGRDDGLVWSGPMGRRHSLTLAGNVSRQGAYGWGGEHANLEAHVKETIQRLGGKGLPDREFGQLTTFLRSTKPIPAAEATPDALATRGAAVFRSDQAACSTCHLEASGLSDREAHDVGSGGKFVTPSLAGVGARSTLFHDGRFASLDLLLAGSTEMGGGTKLNADDRKALAAFLKTL